MNKHHFCSFSRTKQYLQDKGVGVLLEFSDNNNYYRYGQQYALMDAMPVEYILEFYNGVLLPLKHVKGVSRSNFVGMPFSRHYLGYYYYTKIGHYPIDPLANMDYKPKMKVYVDLKGKLFSCDINMK